MRPFSTRWFVAAALLVGATGCDTVVGNYLGNRLSDFGDCFRLEFRAVSVGVDVKAAGLAQAGLYFESAGAQAAFGWDYGEFIARRGSSLTAKPSLRSNYIVLSSEYRWRNGADAPPERARTAFLVPAGGVTLLGHPDARRIGKKNLWIWRKGAPRWWRVHAWDIEVAVGLGAGIRAGFSPGEFLDFVTGWFGADIAGDDRRLPGVEYDEPGFEVPPPADDEYPDEEGVRPDDGPDRPPRERPHAQPRDDDQPARRRRHAYSGERD